MADETPSTSKEGDKSNEYEINLTKNKAKKHKSSSLINYQLKRLRKDKLENSESTDQTLSKNSYQNEKFTEACMKVCAEEYNNIQTKLGLNESLSCISDNRFCHLFHGPASSSNYRRMSSENVNIFIQVKRYNAALRICKETMTFHVYPCSDTLMNLIKILLHSRGSSLENLSSDIILSRCLKTFQMIFYTHPPCNSVLRENYLKFLIEEPTGYFGINIARKLKMDHGLFKFIIQQLACEFNSETKEPLLIESTSTIQDSSVENDFEKLNIAYHAFQYLPRDERLKRLFLVMEIIIELLETDLAIWIKKYINSTVEGIRPPKPLMAMVLWNENTKYDKCFNDTCLIIIRLFITIIKKTNVPDNISLFYRLINTMFHTFNHCEGDDATTFPNYGKYNEKFIHEMFELMKDENMQIIVKTLQVVNCKLFRHLLSAYALKNILKTNEKNYIKIVLDVFNNQSWSKFQLSEHITNEIKPEEKYNTLNSNDLKKDCDNSFMFDNVTKENIKDTTNSFEQVNLKNCDADYYFFMELFYYSIESFLESYKLEKIEQVYNNMDQNICVPEISTNKNCESDDFLAKFNLQIKMNTPIIKNTFSLNASSVENIKFLLLSMRDISVLYNRVKHSNILLHNLFKNITMFKK